MVNTGAVQTWPQDGAFNSQLLFHISLLQERENEVMKITCEEVVLTAWKLKIIYLTFTFFGHRRPCSMAGYLSCVGLVLH